MAETMLQQGIDLMVYGMASVFLFLVILVTVITLVSGVIDRFFCEQESTPKIGHIKYESSLSQPAPVKILNTKLLAIMQNAIDQHRGNQ
jgi:oxaloacetate decarboxylase gamma subunit